MASFSNLDNVQGASAADINSPQINDQGKSTVPAISTPEQALGIAQKLERDDKRRDFRRARVVGAFNGNAPYSDDELQSQGQSWAFNVSFGFMEGIVGRALTAYLSFGADVNKLAEIEGKLPEEKMDIIREEFVEAVKRWGKWLKFYTRWIQELVVQGWSLAAFPDEYGPFPIFIPQRDGFVPEASGNDVDEVDVFVWRKSYLIHDLYKLIQDRKAAEAAGWNYEATIAAINAASPKVIGRNDGETNLQELENSVREGTLSTSILGNKEIKTYHVVVPELDGSITYWIVLNSRSSGKTQLYKRENRFPSMDEFLVYADLEPGDGKWTGSRGIGQRAFNTHRAIDKFRNETLNQTFMGGLAPITVDDTAKQDQLQLSVIGRFMTLPPGVQIIDQRLPTVPQNFMEVDSMLTNTAEQRIGDVVPQSGGISAPDKTATQARFDEARSMQIKEGNLIRFIDPLGKVLSLMVRRLCKFPTGDKNAQEFQKRCLARGITQDDLAGINGARSFGTVSQAMGRMEAGFSQAFGEFRGDPKIDQRRLTEKRLDMLVGEDMAEYLMIPEDDNTIAIEAQRKQFDEINTMQGGLPAPVSPRDDHMIELTTAMKWLGDVIKESMAGNPKEKIQVMDAVLKHALGHLQGVAANPQTKKDAMALKGQLDQMNQAIRGLEVVAKKAQATLERAHGSPHALPTGAATPAAGIPPPVVRAGVPR